MLKSETLKNIDRKLRKNNYGVQGIKKTYYKLHKEPFASFYSDFYSYTRIPFAFAGYY